jgi:hypothetical protein
MKDNEILETKTFKAIGNIHNYGFVCVSPEHPLYGIDTNDSHNKITIDEKREIQVYEYNYIIKIFDKKYYIDDLIEVHGGIFNCGFVKDVINNDNLKIKEFDNIPDDWWYFSFVTDIPVVLDRSVIDENNFDEEFLDKELKCFEKQVNRISELILEFEDGDIYYRGFNKLYGKKEESLKDVNFKSGDIVKHIKTGNLYKVLHIGYRADTDIPYTSQMPQVIYTRKEDDIPEVWTRNLHQFKIRFKLIN